MKKNLNLEKLAAIGSRWEKNGMNRFYINLDNADDMYFDLDDTVKSHGRLSLNRYERKAGKVWIDLDTLTIATKGISNADEVITEVEELIAALDPEEPAIEDAETAETTEESESSETWYAVQSDDYDAWDNGSSDIDAARQIALELIQSGKTGVKIAVIVNGNYCESEITDFAKA